jgi:hypothetical protein
MPMPDKFVVIWKKIIGTWKVAADIFNTDNQSKDIGRRDEDKCLDETALVSYADAAADLSRKEADRYTDGHGTCREALKARW